MKPAVETETWYELLPAFYRLRDSEAGWPLRALLQAMQEQADVVERDIDRLYDNWFIETCDPWVVPYIGELIGYRSAHDSGGASADETAEDRRRQQILVPRRAVANTLRYRSRKGSLALLELLADDVAGWPARAVELYRRLLFAQSLNHLRPERGRVVDLRNGDALDRLDGPFDELAHTVDVRRIDSHRSRGLHNIPSVALFAWRIRPYSVSLTPAYCLEEVGPHCFTFSVLGNDTPLYASPREEAGPAAIAGELNLPTPIRRRAFRHRLGAYYGRHRSLVVWKGQGRNRRPVPQDDILAADLSGWQYRTPKGRVAVDPVLGRISFPPGDLPKGVWVSYRYGFSGDLGGGEYDRPVEDPHDPTLYRVGEGSSFPFHHIRAAYERWRQDLQALLGSGVDAEAEPGSADNEGGETAEPAVDEDALRRLRTAVIEVGDGGVYSEQLNFELGDGETLVVRAANGARPVIRLLDWQTDLPDSLTVTGGPESRFRLDGMMVTGRGVRVEGPLVEVTIRHATLVPGWGLQGDCEPRRPAEPSLELRNVRGVVEIAHSIVGSIQVLQDEVRTDPVRILVSDSFVDATDPDREAFGAPGWPLAHAILTLRRVTVVGRVLAHAIELAEDGIFLGAVHVGRRQVGCMRYCYVAPGSRTPRRYRCQPDGVVAVIDERFRNGELSSDARDRMRRREALRVVPEFNSVRYGRPAYGQLADTCAPEISWGAHDESEMGAFHDLFQPQRAANLHARISEFTPAGFDVGIVVGS
jgi:hypothetical protein